jgi:hypothetical protein
VDGDFDVGHAGAGNTGFRTLATPGGRRFEVSF